MPGEGWLSPVSVPQAQQPLPCGGVICRNHLSRAEDELKPVRLIHGALLELGLGPDELCGSPHP